MADGGLHRTAYGTNPHSLSSSAIDSATASGITDRDFTILLSRENRGTDATIPKFNFRGATLDDVSDALREALKMRYERYGTSIKRLEVTEKQARDRNRMLSQIGGRGFSRPLAHGGAGSGGGGSGRGR